MATIDATYYSTNISANERSIRTTFKTAIRTTFNSAIITTNP